MSVLTFTCQHDHCAQTGTDPAEFKMVEVESRGIRFSYIVCNEHAASIDTEGNTP